MQIASIQTIQEVPQIIGIRTKLIRCEIKSQIIRKLERIDAALKKISKFLYLQQRTLNSKNRISSYQLRNKSAGNGQLLHARALADVLIFDGRLINNYF